MEIVAGQRKSQTRESAVAKRKEKSQPSSKGAQPIAQTAGDLGGKGDAPARTVKKGKTGYNPAEMRKKKEN